MIRFAFSFLIAAAAAGAAFSQAQGDPKADAKKDAPAAKPKELPDPPVAWGGPNVVNPSYNGHRRIDVPDDIQELLRESRGIVGSVKPRDVTFAQALATARSLFGEGWKKFADDNPDRKDIGALQANAAVALMRGDATGAMAHVLLAHETNQNSAEALFNLAGLLARVGMPNEALAVLAEIERRGKKPEIALGMDSDAAIAYVRGWCEMLRGRLEPARTNLRAAAAREPFLSEARHTLTMVESAAGDKDEARKQYYLGVWRRTPKSVMVCGGAKDSAGTKVPAKEWKRADPARSDSVQIAPEDHFDLSNGKFGVLPQFNHPNNVDEAKAFVKKAQPVVERMVRELLSETELGRLTAAAHRHPNEAERVYCDRITRMIESLDRVHPVVRALYDEEQKSFAETREHANRIHKDVFEKFAKLLKTPGDHDAEYRELADSEVNRLRPHIQGYDMAMRRYHRIWHRYATGLAANIGEPTWLKMNVRTIQLKTEAHWGRIVSLATTWYMVPTGYPIKPRQANADDVGSPEKTDVDGCPSKLKGHGAKFEFGLLDDFKFSIKFGCEKTTLELSKKIIGTPKLFPIDASLSGFVSVEVERKGDTTIFVGPSARVGVQAPGGTGFGVTAKEGVGVRVGRDGVKDVITKITVESYERVGPGGSLITTQKGFEKTFSFMPAPPTPTGGPRLTTFGGQ